MRARFFVAGAIAFALLGGSEAARADRNALHAARSALQRYDLEGRRTIRVLHDLTALLEREIPEESAQEARFLRAVVATELRVLSTLTAHRLDLGEVARAFDVAPEALDDTLRAELETLRRTSLYRGGAEECLHTLAALRDPGMAPLDRPRAALLRVRALLASIGEGDATGAFATLGEDPCPAEACEAPWSAWSASGRRSVSGLIRALRIVNDSIEQGTHGDPFLHALAPTLEQLRERLTGVTVAPSFAAPAGLPEIQDASAPALDAVLFAFARNVCVARVPRVGVTSEGAIRLTEAAPALPACENVALPTAWTEGVGPEPVLVEALRRSLGGARVLGVAVDSSLESRVLWRALLSIERAGLSASYWLGRAPDGTLVGFPIRTAERGDAGVPAEIFVRLGGFTVDSHRGVAEDVPRVRVGEALQFDGDGLLAAVGRHPADAWAVRFMSSVTIAPVVTAAVAARGGADAPVTVLLP